MVFQFDSNVAEKYGVEAAVLIHNLAFWIKKNAANNKHFYEGKFWTYNSRYAFAELFPFWNSDKIRRLFEKLTEENVIFKGNFNQNPFDRTQWYALDESVFELLKIDIKKPVETDQNEVSKPSEIVGENKTIDGAKLPNVHWAKIPSSDWANLPNDYNKNTDNKPDNKTQIEKTALAFFKTSSPSLYEKWEMSFKNEIKDFKHFWAVAESKLEVENLEWDVKKIYYRMVSFSTNYIRNQKNEKQPEMIPQNKLPQSKVIRY